MIKGDLKETYKFNREFYSFFRFPNLKNYINYNYTCQFNNFKQVGDIQFPKITENNLSRIITFGDWSNTGKGKETYNQLLKYTKDADAIVFLGDLSYDLYNKKGEVGNEFMNFAQKVTSAIPFQVRLLYDN